MKIELFNWAGERRVKEVLNAFGYEHKQIVDDELHILMQNFLSEGLNVMILKVTSTECEYVLGLDTRSFGQR